MWSNKVSSGILMVRASGDRRLTRCSGEQRRPLRWLPIRPDPIVSNSRRLGDLASAAMLVRRQDRNVGFAVRTELFPPREPAVDLRLVEPARGVRNQRVRRAAGLSGTDTWPQGRMRTSSPATKSSKQIEHSSVEKYCCGLKGRLIFGGGGVVLVEAMAEPSSAASWSATVCSAREMAMGEEGVGS